MILQVTLVLINFWWNIIYTSTTVGLPVSLILLQWDYINKPVLIFMPQVDMENPEWANVLVPGVQITFHELPLIPDSLGTWP